MNFNNFQQTGKEIAGRHFAGGLCGMEGEEDMGRFRQAGSNKRIGKRSSGNNEGGGGRKCLRIDILKAVARRRKMIVKNFIRAVPEKKQRARSRGAFQDGPRLLEKDGRRIGRQRSFSDDSQGGVITVVARVGVGQIRVVGLIIAGDGGIQNGESPGNLEFANVSCLEIEYGMTDTERPVQGDSARVNGDIIHPKAVFRSKIGNLQFVIVPFRAAMNLGDLIVL